MGTRACPDSHTQCNTRMSYYPAHVNVNHVNDTWRYRVAGLSGRHKLTVQLGKKADMLLRWAPPQQPIRADAGTRLFELAGNADSELVRSVIASSLGGAHSKEFRNKLTTLDTEWKNVWALLGRCLCTAIVVQLQEVGLIVHNKDVRPDARGVDFGYVLRACAKSVLNLTKQVKERADTALANMEYKLLRVTLQACYEAVRRGQLVYAEWNTKHVATACLWFCDWYVTTPQNVNYSQTFSLRASGEILGQQRSLMPTYQRALRSEDNDGHVDPATVFTIEPSYPLSMIDTLARTT